MAVHLHRTPRVGSSPLLQQVEQDVNTEDDKPKEECGVFAYVGRTRLLVLLLLPKAGCLGQYRMNSRTITLKVKFYESDGIRRHQLPEKADFRRQPRILPDLSFCWIPSLFMRNICSVASEEVDIRCF